MGWMDCENAKTCGRTLCVAEFCKEYEPKLQTNAQRIRSMTDEELAEFLANKIPHGDCYGCTFDCSKHDEDIFDDFCKNAFFRWLLKPYKEDL